MKLIKITPIVKLRVKKMILDLFDEYDYVRVHRSGLVSLKRKRWSLRRTRVSLTDLVIGELPKRIAEHAKKLGKGDEYLALFNIQIAAIIHVSSYAEHFCIIDYIWDKYIKLCLEIPTIAFDFEQHEFELDFGKKNFIELDFFENTYWYGIIRFLQKRKLSYSKSKILSKVNEIKNKVPVINF